MSAIYRDADGHVMNTAGPVDRDARCFECGKLPDAYWVNQNGDIYVCEGCAIHVLPRLIADAVAGQSKQYLSCGRLSHRLRDITLAYWMGAANAFQGLLHRWPCEKSPSFDYATSGESAL
jgi:hypothetical protein